MKPVRQCAAIGAQAAGVSVVWEVERGGRETDKQAANKLPGAGPGPEHLALVISAVIAKKPRFFSTPKTVNQ